METDNSLELIELMVDTKNFPLKYTNKIFYGEYPFKVVMEGNLWYHNAMRLAELRDWQRDIYWNCKIINRDVMSAYCKTVEHVEDLLHFFPDLILEVHTPYNQTALDEMLIGSVDIRENLYYGKYRYRAELTKSWKDKDNNGKLEKIIQGLSKSKSNRFHRSRSGYTYIIYTNEKHELARIKLSLKEDNIREVKTCKLFSEL